MKSNTLLRTALFILLGWTVLQACKKDADDPLSTGTPTPIVNGLYSGNLIVTDIYGTVKTETGQLLQNAVVRIGNHTETSDLNGQFRFDDILVDSKRAYVHVSAAGHFNSGAIVDPEEGVVNRTTVRLMQRTVVGTFDDVSGGTVSSAGLTVDFPPNAISFANGGEYTGTVNVSMRPLDMDFNTASTLLPGDMAALDSDNELGVLTSYAMAVFELESPSGDALQLTEGVQASVSFPIPVQSQLDAPSTIPLWSFDETEGVWIEEGQAIRVGDQYEAEVSHFSWWNCDAFGDDAYLTVCLTTDEGINLASGTYASITTAGGLTADGVAGNDGCFETYIPANQPIHLTIYDNCGDPVLNVTIGPFSTNSDNTLTYNADDLDADDGTSITGTIVDCNNVPLSGEVSIQANSVFGWTTILFSDLDANGGFSFTDFGCLSSISDLTLFDGAAYYELPLGMNIIQGQINDVGQLTNCGVDYEFFLVTIDGFQYSEPFLPQLWGMNYPQWYVNGETWFAFDNIGMIGPTPLFDTISGEPAGWIYDWDGSAGGNYDIYASDYTMNVLEYPSVPGEYLEATMTGTSDDPNSPGTSVQIDVHFRLEATQ